MIILLLAQGDADVQKLTEGIKPIIGVEDAPIKIVMFTDPDCPYCRMTHSNIIEYAKSRPDVALYIRLFPLVQIHPNAYRKAEILACTPNEYFPDVMHIIEEHGSREPFSWDWLSGMDKKVVKEIKECVNNDDGKKRVESDLMLGFKVGVRGTPTFFINGKRHVGAMRTPEEVDRVVRAYAQ
ncbi:MAG: thioredoxin domain-containing protein [candidate division WOR-3 bacterium]